MKVFISQPMRGKTDREILDRRDEAVNFLKFSTEEEVEVIDTFFKDFNGNRLEFLGKAIMEGLAKCDTALFIDDYENYDGCACEHFIAKRYGVPIVYFRLREKGSVRKTLEKETMNEQQLYCCYYCMDENCRWRCDYDWKDIMTCKYKDNGCKECEKYSEARLPDELQRRCCYDCGNENCKNHCKVVMGCQRNGCKICKGFREKKKKEKEE